MAKQTAFLLIFLFGVLGATTAADVARSCGTSQTFDSVIVYIGDKLCSSPPCQLVRGETAKCIINFTAAKPIETIKQLINATVVGTGITTRFPVPDAELGCDKLTDTFCPLNAEENATIELAFDVLKIYPQVTLELVIAIVDQNEEQIACFQMNGVVTNS